MRSAKRRAPFSGLLLLAGSLAVGAGSLALGQSRQPQQPAQPENRPPTIRLTSETQVVTLCPEAESMENPRVRLRAEGFSPDGNRLRYRWNVSGGRLEGDGENVVWDLTGVQPGVYTVNATVESGPEGTVDPLCTAFTSARVVVRNCPPPRPICPNVAIYCPDVVEVGRPITFTASLSGGTPGVTPVYTWRVSAGRITSGQGTPSITVDTTGLGGQPINATVEVEGYNLECRATCQSQVPAPPEPRRSDEFGEIARDDEKARLDNFAIELQNSPGAQGYIIGYGGRRPRSADGRARAERARDYLTRTRGIDASRIVILDGGQRESASTALWIVPPGATPPRP
jgi:hypothetical protein